MYPSRPRGVAERLALLFLSVRFQRCHECNHRLSLVQSGIPWSLVAIILGVLVLMAVMLKKCITDVDNPPVEEEEARLDQPQRCQVPGRRLGAGELPRVYSDGTGRRDVHRHVVDEQTVGEISSAYRIPGDVLEMTPARGVPRV
jgi:hypothetical protein